MEPDSSSSLAIVTVAGETAIAVRAGTAKALFAVGPRLGEPLDRRRRLERVREALAPGLRGVRWANQVHGRQLVWCSGGSSEPVRCVGDADGLATAETGIGLAVWTADCVPLALVGPEVVAMVHAGWRGAAAGIADGAVQELAGAGCPPAELTAWLGPAVSSRHYRVGPEVIEELSRSGVPEVQWRDGDRVDLRRFLAAQLRAGGVGRVGSVGGCTFATPELASYRRDGDAAGRQWSMVWRMSG